MSDATVFQDERQAIESAFAAAWDNTCPVQFQNVHFTAPESGPWVRLTIRSGSSTLASIGDAARWHERSAGVIMLQIFVPENSGTAEARALADRFAGIFRLRTLELANNGSVRCFSPRYDAGGEDYEPFAAVDFWRDSYSPTGA